VIAGGVFFEPVYDPYERVAIFQLDKGQRWLPEILYTAIVRGPEQEGQLAGIQAFDGAPLSDQLRFHFTTGASVSDPSRDLDDTWPKVAFCEGSKGDLTLPAPASVLAQSCGSASCHGSGGLTGLDLSTSQAVQLTAIRVTARQTLTGTTVGAPLPNSDIFGESMARIEPSNPGGSYLIYKLLTNPNNYGQVEDADYAKFNGGLPWAGPPGEAELQRLRDAFVRLSSMPLGGSLKPSEMRSLVAWIAQGAKVQVCP